MTPATLSASAGEGGRPHTPSLNIACDHCGSLIGREEPISSGGLTLYPRNRRAEWCGQTIRLTRVPTTILEALMSAPSTLISAAALMERAGYEGSNPSNNIKVHVARLRKLLPGIPIYSDAGIGYAWNPKGIS